MLGLVLWSFVLALTPVALGLTWKLFFGIWKWIGLWPSEDYTDDDPWGRPTPKLKPATRFHL